MLRVGTRGAFPRLDSVGCCNHRCEKIVRCHEKVFAVKHLKQKCDALFDEEQRMICRTIVIIVAMSCLSAWTSLLARPVFADERQTFEKPDKPTLDQIIDGIGRMEKLLFENDSLLIRYERTKSEDFIKTAASGAGLLPAEWTVANKRNKWFSERRYTHPMRTKELLVPAKSKTQIVKDGCVVEWDQDAKFANVASIGDDPNIYTELEYTRILSFDAPKFIARSRGEDIMLIRKTPQLANDVALPFLPEWLSKNKVHYKVLETPEKVDGAICWVVEWPGMDRFWVDPKRGFSILRRAYSWGPGKPLRFQFYQQAYREVKPGLWLPFTQIEEKYANFKAEKESLWGKVAVRSEYHLLAIEFDTLSDSFFDVHLPLGTRVNDMVRGFQYSVSDKNTDPFAAEIADAKKMLSSEFKIITLVSAASLLLVIIVRIFYRMRSHDNRRETS
jgi:hypothetical protein